MSASESSLSPQSKLEKMKRNKVEKDAAGFLPPLVSLKCQLCQQYLDDPVTLQCIHSFCRGCLENYNAENYPESATVFKEVGEDENPEGHEAKDGDIEKVHVVQCPTCIETLDLAPLAHPQVPFENSRLARIVKLVYESNVVCQNCGDAASEVTCKTCGAWMCKPCEEATHDAPIFKSHEREGLSHSEMMALPKCPIHPLNDLEFFSTDEEVGVCQVCLLKGEFVGKPYCLVSDVRKARHEDIQNGVKVIVEEKARLVQAKGEMKEVLNVLDDNLDDQQAAVRENFEAIRNALDQREHDTLAALEKLKNTKADVLNKQIDSIDLILGVIDDGVNNINVVLNHSNDLELVYLTIVLQEFIDDLARIDTPKFKNIEKSLGFYHQPAVDAELPVVLSENVPALVSAYASVPDADQVQDLADGKAKKLNTAKVTGKQKAALDEVAGGKVSADENGCTIQ